VYSTLKQRAQVPQVCKVRMTDVAQTEPHSSLGLRLRRTSNETPAFLRHSTVKKLSYLSWYQTRQERLDKEEIGLERLESGVLMATLDEMQPHRIALKSNVILEQSAKMSSQSQCATDRPDSTSIIHPVKVRNLHCNMHRLRALIECVASSIFMTLRLLQLLRLPHEPAFTSTQGLNGQLIISVKESARRMSRFDILNV